MQKNEVKWNSENFPGDSHGEQLDSHGAGRQPRGRATATGDGEQFDSHREAPRAGTAGITRAKRASRTRCALRAKRAAGAAGRIGAADTTGAAGMARNRA